MDILKKDHIKKINKEIMVKHSNVFYLSNYDTFSILFSEIDLISVCSKNAPTQFIQYS